MVVERNPLHIVLRQHMGLDSFALDGDDTLVSEPWQDRPGRNHSPERRVILR